MSVHSSTVRSAALLLTLGQVWMGVPVVAAPADRQQNAVRPMSTIAAPVERGVLPNRTAPAVVPPSTVLRLPAVPTDEQLSRARVFSQPLVPVGRPTSRQENAALARAILAYRDLRRIEAVAPLLEFIGTFPQSAWRASLFANLGTVYLASGYFGKALAAWDLAWVETGAQTDAHARIVADFALGEWLALSARLGHVDAVAARLADTDARPLHGPAARQREAAWGALGVLSRHIERSTPSGPAALGALLAYADPQVGTPSRAQASLARYNPAARGTSLSELQQLARGVGLNWRMAVRPRDAALPIPSIVHLRIGSYAAVVKRDDGGYLLIDPAIGMRQWVSQDVIDEETSGYVLAPASSLDGDWAEVTASQAIGIFGLNCAPGGSDSNDPGPPPCGGPGGPPPGSPPGGPPAGPPCQGSFGMAAYTLLPNANLRVSDQPLTYRAVVGPSVDVRFTYNQRESRPLPLNGAGNLGPQWTFDWQSFVEDDPTHTMIHDTALVDLRGGGKEEYNDPDASGAYPVHWRSRATLVRVSDDPVRYERRLSDGGVEVFAVSDGVITYPRHVYLTEIADPRGLALHLTYDADLRLVAVTDASGLVTTLAYDRASDPGKMTSVTDPYGRVATLTYNASGQLSAITDSLGLISSFIYGPDDFMMSLTTPYGTTRFSRELNPTNALWMPAIQATDPAGGTERVEYRVATSDLPASAPPEEVPTGFAEYNARLDTYNSLYWDKRTLAQGPPVASTAVVTRLLLTGERGDTPSRTSSVPHSIKRPLEHRVWYTYPGQEPHGPSWTDEVGMGIQPAQTARVLDDGTTQAVEATYNAQGQVTSRTDALGRRTSDLYAANGNDLLEVRQTTNGLNELLASYSNYTSQHQPQTMIDAAGQTTTYTYDSVGQPLTITNAKQETTTLTYDADHRMASFAQPMTGAITSYTYDGYGRVRAVTDADGFTVTRDYDAFDRPTQVTYPDGTTERTTYSRLDVATRTDRLGRVTRYYHDAVRHLVGTRDAQGRVVSQSWCACGSLDQVSDANGHATRWERDAEGRVTREVRADGVTATTYTYDGTGRLITMTDPKGQVTTYAYNLDDSVQQLAFTNAAIPTAAVSYTYDTNYPRVATMGDGTGTTTYAYQAPGALGAGQVASVDGPLTDDTITYTYDELGRVTSRAINGVAASQAYDPLGRVTTETNVLGTFTYGYDGVTSRLATVSYPNGQTSAYRYFDNLGDRRLQTIHHQYPDGSTLSRFDYTYDAVGNIRTWRQQADATAVLWTYGYDAADQLTSAVKLADPMRRCCSGTRMPTTRRGIGRRRRSTTR